MNLLVAGLFCIVSFSSLAANETLQNQTDNSDTTFPLFPESVSYHFDTLKGKSAVVDFTTTYTAEQRDIIYAINRISSSRIAAGRVLVMPDTLSAEILDYSPYPDSVKAFDTLPKLILISRRIQAFAIYENGQLTRWGPVSSGKKSTPTPAGLFHTNFKAKIKISSENSEWIMPWYFNFYARRGIAVHQFYLPGYPASHACVRMQEKDAKWIFDWADQWRVSGKTGAVTKVGTPVIIFGDYDFTKPVPWINLPGDKLSTQVKESEFEEIYSYLPVIYTDVILRK